MPMFKSKGPEFQCLKNRARIQILDWIGIQMFERIEPEFQCLKENGRNSNV